LLFEPRYLCNVLAYNNYIVLSLSLLAIRIKSFKPFSRKLEFRVLVARARIVSFLNVPTYAVLFNKMISVSFWILTKIIRDVFEKIVNLLFFGEPIWRVILFVTGLLVFTHHRPTMDKLLNTECEKIYPTVQSRETSSYRFALYNDIFSGYGQSTTHEVSERVAQKTSGYSKAYRQGNSVYCILHNWSNKT
jgi:hypothetical protein